MLVGGVIHGIRSLEVLRSTPVAETHLVMSTGTKRTIPSCRQIILLSIFYALAAHCCYRINDIAAAISSGSFKTAGMARSSMRSMKTLSGIASFLFG